MANQEILYNFPISIEDANMIFFALCETTKSAFGSEMATAILQGSPERKLALMKKLQLFLSKNE